jgi:hypothetical protein
VNDETIARRDSTYDNRDNPGSSAGAAPALARDTTPANRTIANRDQEPMVPLLSDDDCKSFRSRWENLQVGFVDEPRRAVEQADRLVTDAINTLAKGFSSQREGLEQQWHREQDASTEDLRQAFRRYRSFFERLLSL